MIYEPRQCVICGKVFVPTRKNEILCSDPACKKARHRQKIEAYKPKHNAARKRQREEAKLIKEHRKPKPDTIVAIGYADRQKAETLRMAGRVDPHL